VQYRETEGDGEVLVGKEGRGGETGNRIEKKAEARGREKGGGGGREDAARRGKGGARAISKGGSGGVGMGKGRCNLHNRTQRETTGPLP